MKRTAWAMAAMFISLGIGTAIAVGSMLSAGGRLNLGRLTASPLTVPTLLVSCLDPLAILFEVVAIVLILTDCERWGGSHRRLARMGAVFFIVWGVLNLGVFLALSFQDILGGSPGWARSGQLVRAGAALLQYVLPFILVYRLSPKTARVLLWAALGLTVIGNLGVLVLAIGSAGLPSVGAAEQGMALALFVVDYTSAPYPMLLGLGYAGGGLYMLAYLLTGLSLFRQGRRQPPGRVEVQAGEA